MHQHHRNRINDRHNRVIVSYWLSPAVSPEALRKLAAELLEASEGFGVVLYGEVEGKLKAAAETGTWTPGRVSMILHPGRTQQQCDLVSGSFGDLGDQADDMDAFYGPA